MDVFLCLIPTASKQDMCYLHANATGTEACGQEDSRKIVDTSTFWVLMATGSAAVWNRFCPHPTFWNILYR